MMNPMIATHMAAQGTRVIHSRSACLGSVIINTTAASAVLTIYNNSAGSGDIIAIVDASSKSGGGSPFNVACPAGLTAVLSGGNADVTITSEGPSA